MANFIVGETLGVLQWGITIRISGISETQGGDATTNDELRRESEAITDRRVPSELNGGVTAARAGELLHS